MTHLQLVRTPARTLPLPRPLAPEPRIAAPPRPLDAQLWAADVLGRILDVFETLDSCSRESLEKARGLLVGELLAGEVEERRRPGSPHDRRRRNAVLTAAVGCVQAAAEHGEADGDHTPFIGATWRDGTNRAAEARLPEAARLLHRVRRVLDGVAAVQDPEPGRRQPAVADVLAHMLRGPEPRMWSRERRDFARSVLEWMREPGR
ncbi:MAG TPA: hypothetical protein VK858_15690 [Longimicrobiales bacterium]|nr:hypothetical protein [Longimicrobiales bacterium]